MTGVEAISNGVPAFKDPAPKRAALALLAISIILGVLLAGVAYLAHVDGIMATDPNSPAYQSILSQIVSRIAGRGWIYYVTMGSVLAVLCLSANTSFAGFPRLCRLIAEDGYLPNAFANTGRRLVYSEGIVVLAVLTGVILVMFGGVTDRLIPLFAIGAFLTFTLSQAGMVQHWLKQARERAANSRSIGLPTLGQPAGRHCHRDCLRHYHHRQIQGRRVGDADSGSGALHRVLPRQAALRASGRCRPATSSRSTYHICSRPSSSSPCRSGAKSPAAPCATRSSKARTCTCPYPERRRAAPGQSGGSLG